MLVLLLLLRRLAALCRGSSGVPGGKIRQQITRTIIAPNRHTDFAMAFRVDAALRVWMLTAQRCNYQRAAECVFNGSRRADGQRSTLRN